jgi:transcriptional regulator with XRE-family HTH domain
MKILSYRSVDFHSNAYVRDMPVTRSTEYCTADELAQIANRVRNESHAKIAKRLDVSRSAVSHALGDQPEKHVKLLCRILDLYGVDTDAEPRYAIQGDLPADERTPPEWIRENVDSKASNQLATAIESSDVETMEQLVEATLDGKTQYYRGVGETTQKRLEDALKEHGYLTR